MGFVINRPLASSRAYAGAGCHPRSWPSVECACASSRLRALFLTLQLPSLSPLHDLHRTEYVVTQSADGVGGNRKPQLFHALHDGAPGNAVIAPRRIFFTTGTFAGSSTSFTTVPLRLTVCFSHGVRPPRTRPCSFASRLLVGGAFPNAFASHSATPDASRGFERASERWWKWLASR
jgi:hypothetical protein